MTLADIQRWKDQGLVGGISRKPNGDWDVAELTPEGEAAVARAPRPQAKKPLGAKQIELLTQLRDWQSRYGGMPVTDADLQRAKALKKRGLVTIEVHHPERRGERTAYSARITAEGRDALGPEPKAGTEVAHEDEPHHTNTQRVSGVLRGLGYKAARDTASSRVRGWGDISAGYRLEQLRNLDGVKLRLYGPSDTKHATLARMATDLRGAGFIVEENHASDPYGSHLLITHRVGHWEVNRFVAVPQPKPKAGTERPASDLGPGWKPGGYGKGVLAKDGTVYTWRTDEGGWPTHDDFTAGGQAIEWAAKFDIERNGHVWVYPVAGHPRDFDKATATASILQSDPRLRIGFARWPAKAGTEAKPLDSRHGYKYVRDGSVHVANSLDALAKLLAQDFGTGKHPRIVVNTSPTKERELTPKEQSYVVGKARKQVLGTHRGRTNLRTDRKLAQLPKAA